MDAQSVLDNQDKSSYQLIKPKEDHSRVVLSMRSSIS
jgi:hypothetical protein